MIYPSDSVRRAAAATRFFAGVLVILAVINMVAGSAIIAANTNEQFAVTIVGVLVAIYVCLAAMLLWFATAILKVQRWAVIGALCTSFSLAILSTLSAIRLGGKSTPFWHLVFMIPAMSTAILCARALRDIKPQARPRGFPVVKTRPAPTTMPIPPVASRLAPRRGNQLRQVPRDNQQAQEDAAARDEV